MAGFPTLNGSWPCPCQLQSHVTPRINVNNWARSNLDIDFQLLRARDLDLGSGHTAYRHASLMDLYLHAKFH